MDSINQRTSSSFPSSSSSFPSSSSSSSTIPQWKYDVFLSFRGEDTRKNFTGHLYTSLNQKGIYVFIDDPKLERGKTIGPELLRAIKESRISIIIFSRTYASSTWCLDELAQIVECKNELGQIVVPVFYHVEPSDVRKQRGSFEEAFSKHEETFRDNPEKVQRWRGAMTEAANLSGFPLGDRPEAEFIQVIVKDISSKLIPTNLSAVEGLVGIHWRLEELRNLHIRIGLDNVGMIGICGMGGIGKTTIARVFYKWMSCQFEGSSFLVNVREVSESGDVIRLQKQLLSEMLKERDIDVWNADDGMDMIRRRLCRKRVLVVIDDVNQLDQLEKLAGKHDWFGSGSRIIITSRDKSLLDNHGVNKVYMVEELEHDEALRLFSLKAFKNDHLPEDFVELSTHFVNYAKGLPLALKVVGSFLFDKKVHEWKSALERLEVNPEKEIFDVLKLSFDGLKESEKEIFLDVACFFNGKQKDHVMRILNCCGFFAEIGMRVLIDKSLIIMSDYEIRMHDLLQDLGCQIVRQESLGEPGERSRLWLYRDVYHVLTKNTGTEKVGAMVLGLPELKGAQLSAKAFSKLNKLRLLKLRNVHISNGLEYLSNELRFLQWHGYPFRCMPSSFQPDKLVELDMCFSHIKQLWKGIEPLNELKELKIIKLSHSQKLIRAPDFRMIPYLEQLILEGCIGLLEVGQSIGVLEKLTLLNLKDCKSLVRLPSSIYCLKSLKTLNLSGCSKLENIQENLGNVECLECLEELDVSGTAIKALDFKMVPNLEQLILVGCTELRKVGQSIGVLEKLSLLNLKDCKNLVSLPSSIYCLKSLKMLNLSGCSKLEIIPENSDNVECLECLEELDLSRTAIRQPPSSILNLKNLKELSFRGCKGPPTRSWRFWLDPMPLMLPSLSGLCCLTKLDLHDCNLWEGAIPNDIGCLSALSTLNLSSTNVVGLPASISQLSNLNSLQLENCNRLQSLPELPSNLKYVPADACSSLKALPDLFACGFGGFRCFQLMENQGYNSMAVARMKRFLQVMCDSSIPSKRDRFDIIIPGDDIPEWFSHRGNGNSISIKRPPSLLHNSKLMGFALCSVFVVHEHQPVLYYGIPFSLHTHELWCEIHADGTLSTQTAAYPFDVRLGQAVSDHIWLLYLAHPSCYFDNTWKQDYSNIAFSFRISRGNGVEVKKCGVRPVYEYDVDEYNQTTDDKYTSSFFEKGNDLHQDVDGSA